MLLRATIVRTVANVRNAYWDLVFAIQAEVVKNSLALATEARRRQSRTRRSGNTGAAGRDAGRSRTGCPASGCCAGAGHARHRGARAQAAHRQWHRGPVLDGQHRARRLTDLLNRNARRRSRGQTCTAHAHRFLEQSKKQVLSNDVSIRSLTDAQLPSLDLTASYGVAGIGGTQFVRPPGLALGAAPTQVIPSGFTDALSLLGDGRAPTWNFLLNFSYPIGTSPAEAATARARLQQRQTIAQQPAAGASNRH